jgi:hypothetical protein
MFNAIKVPPNIAPPTTSFCTKFPAPAPGATVCPMYVLDCRNAFRAFVRVLTGVVVLEVKKLAAGLELWNDRTEVDLKADFEATPRVEVSLKGCRMVNAILR